MEHSGVLPTTQFAYRKGLGTRDALMCVPHTLKVHSRVGRTYFSAACDRANNKGILNKLCSVGIGCVLSILTQFLLNQWQNVKVDGCRNRLVNVVPGGPLGSVLCSLLFLLNTSELLSI